MKFCVFHKNQSKLLTMFNPLEMVALGIFDADYRFMSPSVYQLLFGEKIKSRDSLASSDYFTTEESIVNDVVAKSEERRKKFFNWYVQFYYKVPGWEDGYEYMVGFHKAEVYGLYKLLVTTNQRDEHDHIKQALLECAWDYHQDPTTVINFET